MQIWWELWTLSLGTAHAHAHARRHNFVSTLEDFTASTWSTPGLNHLSGFHLSHSVILSATQPASSVTSGPWTQELVFFLHQFPNVYKIANTKTNFLSGMVQTEMRVISSMVIKFPYSDARSQGPQGVLRSHSAPNNQICNAATDSLRWWEARILCQGQPWVTACLGCPQAESKEKGEMRDRSMSPPLRSLPGPPSTVNSCLIWTLAAHQEGCNYSLWNGLADLTVRCVLLCLPQSVSDLRSKSTSASQPNCPVTTVWKGRRVAPSPTSVGVGGRGGEDAALLKSWKSWEVTPYQLEQSAHDQALVHQGVHWSG